MLKELGPVRGPLPYRQDCCLGLIHRKHRHSYGAKLRGVPQCFTSCSLSLTILLGKIQGEMMASTKRAITTEIAGILFLLSKSKVNDILGNPQKWEKKIETATISYY